MTINSIEDYELSYNLFLYEQEVFNNLSNISIKAVTESTSLIALQEGVKETVMNYLQKIMTQIQKIWSKFKAVFSEKVANFLEKQCKPTLEKAKNASFTVNNYVQYDLSKMNGIDIKPFNYNDQSKEILQSESEYLKATYPSIAGDGNIKTGLTKLVAKKIDKFDVNSDVLEEMFKYCKTDYKKDVDAISKEIDDLNNSSKTITSMVSTVISAQEAYNVLTGFGICILTEADDDPTKGEKQTFTDNSGEVSGDSKDNDKAKGQITTAVTVYMSASTKLLSAKMSMVNGKFKSYINILNHLVTSYAKNKTAVVADKVKEKIPTSAPQVDIKK